MRRLWFYAYLLVKYLPDSSSVNRVIPGTWLRSKVGARVMLSCGKNVRIQQNVGLCFNLEVGDNVLIAKRVSFYPNVKVGSNVIIGHDSIFITHSKKYLGLEPEGIIIEDNVNVGYRNIVLQGVRLGKGCMTGAGAVISKDVPAGCLVVGFDRLVRRL
jgi:acetyltransferase-like isoleucine patch superfamily enzyme